MSGQRGALTTADEEVAVTLAEPSGGPGRLRLGSFTRGDEQILLRCPEGDADAPVTTDIDGGALRRPGSVVLAYHVNRASSRGRDLERWNLGRPKSV